MILTLAVAGVLVVAGNLTGAHATSSALAIPVRLAVAGAAVAVAVAAGADAGTLGAAPARMGAGVAWGLGAAVVLVGGMVLVVRVRALRPLVTDRRYTSMTPGEVRHRLLVRVPLGVALPEEVAFRSALLALATAATSAGAGVALTGVAFGLFHVAAAAEQVRANHPGARASAVVAGVVTGVIVTGLGGVIFGLLRVASGSLAAPVLAHAAVNWAGTLAARSAGRR